MIKASIVNVVATTALGQRVDLEDLQRYPEILRDPEVYGGRVAYFRSSKITGEVTIFPSGKMISAGTKSEIKAFDALEYVKDFLAKEGFIRPVSLKKRIENIVAVVDLNRSVNLEELAQTHSKIIYEPEQFPGAIMRIEEPSRATMLIFASGKAVIAGLKSSPEIAHLTRKLEEIVQFRS
jgi:transcription initiation factor TFIID TATA-box-binding protein